MVANLSVEERVDCPSCGARAYRCAIHDGQWHCGECKETFSEAAADRPPAFEMAVGSRSDR